MHAFIYQNHNTTHAKMTPLSKKKKKTSFWKSKIYLSGLIQNKPKNAKKQTKTEKKNKKIKHKMKKTHSM
jgi:hypothetical protein